MSKFHLNAKGEAGKCRAAKGKCPFGSADEHYDTPEEARSAFEKLMTEKKEVPVVALSDLVGIVAFEKAIEDGNISERAHADDPNLRVYSYTKQVQFSGYWTPETLLARGLILRLPDGVLANAEIVGRGLPKFFTVEQMAEGDWTRVKLVDDDEGVTVSEAPEISWDAPAVVSEKMNGALGLAYVAPDGGISISTKGSFGSLEAEVGTELIRKLTPEQQAEFAELALRGKTPLFEIITPKRPHPVVYGDKEALVILGSIDNATGKWSPAEQGGELAEKFGFESSEQLEYSNLADAVRAPYRQNTEGFVVTVAGRKGQELYKVKPAEYHALRKFFYASNPKDLAFNFSQLSGEELSKIASRDSIEFSPELVGSLPSDSPLIADRKRIAYDELIVPVQKSAQEAKDKVNSIVANLGESYGRRELAEAINKEPQEQRGLLFKAYQDIENGGHSVYEAARTTVFKTL